MLISVMYEYVNVNGTEKQIQWMILVEADQADITKSDLEYNLFWLQSSVEKKKKKG